MTTAAPHASALTRLQRVLHGGGLALCMLAALLAGVELWGWGLGKALPVPGSVRMVPNTALGLLWGGLALALLLAPRTRRWRRLGQALAALTLGVGLLTLIQYGLAIDLGIDRLLFPQAVQRLEVQLAGRPAPVTALSLSLIGLALVLLEVESRRGHRPAQYLALGAGSLALQGLLRYVYQEERLSSSGTHFLPMAMNTALAFLALASGILLARPERGLMAVVLRDSVGGLMARRLIPAALLIPILAGWLPLLGERLGFYATAFGVSLVAVLTSLGFLFIIVRNARALHSLDSLRLRTEQALRVSEQRLAGIISSAGEAIISVDDRQRVTLFNESAERIFGYSATEVLGQPLEVLLPELQRAPHWQQSLGSQKSVRGRRKSGEEFPAEATISKLEVGGRWLFTAILRDITERKQLELAWRFLAETGPRLADSLDSRETLARVAKLVVPDLADWCVIELADEQARILKTECAAEDPAKEALLRAFLARASHDAATHGRIVAEVVRTGVPALMPEVPDAALENAAEDAEHLALLRRLAPLSSIVVPLCTRGRTLGALVLATCSDGSGRRYGDKELTLAMEVARRAALAIDNAHLYRRSEEATGARDEVMRIVAHDLRSPLQAIVLSVGKLLGRLSDECAPERKPLEIIQRAVSRATRLIEDLLDVARLETGNLVVEPKPQPLRAIVDESLELNGTLAHAKGLQLLATLPEACPPVWVDRDRVLQVLSNLLGNAIKFTPKGGRVTVGAKPQGDRVCLSVTDTGPGIDAEHLPHVFTAFWQVRRGDKNGAGLGLAIALGIIEAHGGKLWVESQPGQGTTFFFTLPTVEPKKKKGPGD